MTDLTTRNSIPSRPGRRGRRRLVNAPARPAIGWFPAFERLENRCVMSTAASWAAGAVSLPTDPTVQVSGNLNQAGGRQVYEVSLDAQGLLTATVQTSGMNTLLSLEDNQGNTLIQAEATSTTNPDDRLAQHLQAGIYYLSVTGMTGGGELSPGDDLHSGPCLPARRSARTRAPIMCRRRISPAMARPTSSSRIILTIKS